LKTEKPLKKYHIISGIFLLTLLLQLLAIKPALVQADDTDPQENSNKGLCLPGDTELLSNQDCQMAGPAQRLSDYAAIGLTFPPAPIFVTTAPADLGTVPFQYAKVTNDEVPLYDTPADVEANHPSGKLPISHIKYVSLYDHAVTSKGLYYQIANGKWISREAATKVGVPFFQGFEFKENPTTSFGWILDETDSRKTPSINGEKTGKHYSRFNVVPVYASVMENQVEWVMIGPDEWVDKKSISRVIPNNNKPEGVKSDRWIEVNLYDQVMLVHDGGRIVYATLVATGVKPFYTKPGVFTIYKKIDHEYMRGAFEADRSDYYYLEDVPYIMYYDQSRALHGAYWHTNFGYQQSHGCVNLSIADSHWLYDWAKMGEYVYVWDPSGKTPTDPSLYGAGGF